MDMRLHQIAAICGWRATGGAISEDTIYAERIRT